MTAVVVQGAHTSSEMKKESRLAIALEVVVPKDYRLSCETAWGAMQVSEETVHGCRAEAKPILLGLSASLHSPLRKAWCCHRRWWAHPKQGQPEAMD